MTMNLSILDLDLIGSTTGLTTLASMYITMRLMQRFSRKRKALIMEEMLGKMHDDAHTEAEFSDIVERLKDQRGGFHE